MLFLTFYIVKQTYHQPLFSLPKDDDSVTCNEQSNFEKDIEKGKCLFIITIFFIRICN